MSEDVNTPPLLHPVPCMATSKDDLRKQINEISNAEPKT